MERFTNSLFVAAIGVFAVFAAVTAVAMITGNDDAPTRPATDDQASVAAQATRQVAEQAKQRREARERTRRRRARDKRRTSEVERTWNDSPFLGRRAAVVRVRSGTVTVTAIPEDPSSAVSTVPGLCENTLREHRWLVRLRVKSTTGKVLYHGLRGDQECFAGAIPEGREPASRPAPKPAAVPLPSNDELAVQSFHRYVRQAAPDAPWDEVLDDVYMTGVVTSTLTLEINDPSVPDVMCRAARAWMDDTNYRFASKAKVYTSVRQGRSELAQC